jgi:alkylhydroperoxidase/carboxymuconolactone decarboxylase family protein YurZ
MKNNLTIQEQQIIAIAAATATGKIDALKTSLVDALTAKLTINQINEVLAQMYAYAGFPRSLTSINIFMGIMAERKERGIIDDQGPIATVTDNGGDKYERGRKVLEQLTKQPQTKPAKEFGEFNPTIDKFLKEHLFADIFDSDILTYRQRELATIGALSSLSGVDGMLQAHINMGMNVGITKAELESAFTVIEETIGKAQADNAKIVFNKVLVTRNH